MKEHTLSAWTWTPKLRSTSACESAAAQLCSDADALRAHAKRRTLFAEDLQLAGGHVCQLVIQGSEIAAPPRTQAAPPDPDDFQNLPEGVLAN